MPNILESLVISGIVLFHTLDGWVYKYVPQWSSSVRVNTCFELKPILSAIGNLDGKQEADNVFLYHGEQEDMSVGIDISIARMEPDSGMNSEFTLYPPENYAENIRREELSSRSNLPAINNQN